MSEYCCNFFETCIKLGQIITKEQAFPDLKHDLDIFEKHPNYLLFIAHENPMHQGYLWLHFCSNCGFKHSTDEQIDHWNKLYKTSSKK